MIRYGIVVEIEDIFEIEARKKKENRNEFMVKLIEENIRDSSEEEKKMFRREIKENIIAALWSAAIMDDLEKLFFKPLKVNTFAFGQESKIFIGIETRTDEDTLLSFSFIEKVIPLQERNNINRILDEKGYGRYKPDFWLIATDESGDTQAPYNSSEKLP